MDDYHITKTSMIGMELKYYRDTPLSLEERKLLCKALYDCGFTAYAEERFPNSVEKQYSHE